jgi:hypothetical protein
LQRRGLTAALFFLSVYQFKQEQTFRATIPIAIATKEHAYTANYLCFFWWEVHFSRVGLRLQKFSVEKKVAKVFNICHAVGA